MVALVVTPPSGASARSDGMPAWSIENATQKKQEIERLVQMIRSGGKPLPAWALDLIMRAYDAYKTHQNGKEIASIREMTLGILREVADLKVRIERGEELSDGEYRTIRERLDVFAFVLADHERRLKANEHSLALIKGRVFRRGCGVRHAWRGGRCVDVTAGSSAEQ
jgi:hypothetical protein